MVLSVDIPDGLREEIESEVDKGLYKNKSELVRDAIRRLLEERDKIEHRTLSEEAVKRIRHARGDDKTYTLEEAKEKLGV